MRRLSTAFAAPAFISSAMPRLLRFIMAKGADSPSVKGPLLRMLSPSGSRSTLITSAPMSASNCPQVGAAMTWLISITRVPQSRPLSSSPTITPP